MFLACCLELLVEKSYSPQKNIHEDSCKFCFVSGSEDHKYGELSVDFFQFAVLLTLLPFN